MNKSHMVLVAACNKTDLAARFYTGFHISLNLSSVDNLWVILYDVPAMISVFANIRINDPERLEHFKDSFYSFQEMSDDWVINVRGHLRKPAIDFLKQELQGRATFFEFLDDDRGWMVNALEMMPMLKHEYVFLWNEDHINMCSAETTQVIIAEAIASQVDYLNYGHFEHWRKKFNRVLTTDLVTHGQLIDVANVTKQTISNFFPERKRDCIISSTGIFRKSVLIQLMKREGKKFPFALTIFLRKIIGFFGAHIFRKLQQHQFFDDINKLFFCFKFPRFPKQTPFELEITQDQQYVLPLRVASPHQEFFACIDDDVYKNGSMRGYQLIKRGQYPVRNLLQFTSEIPPHMQLRETRTLQQGESFSDRYYMDSPRTAIPLQSLIRTSGSLSVRSGSEHVIVKPQQLVLFYPNIRSMITAIESSTIEIYCSATGNAPVVHPEKDEYDFPNL